MGRVGIRRIFRALGFLEGAPLWEPRHEIRVVYTDIRDCRSLAATTCEGDGTRKLAGRRDRRFPTGILDMESQEVNHWQRRTSLDCAESHQKSDMEYALNAIASILRSRSSRPVWGDLYRSIGPEDYIELNSITQIHFSLRQNHLCQYEAVLFWLEPLSEQVLQDLFRPLFRSLAALVHTLNVELDLRFCA